MAESTGGVETVFTWDLALDVPQVLATSDGAKNLYGLERIGVEQGGAWRYTLADALGSVRQWTDPAGAVLGVQSYGPFGEAREPVATPPWGFTGEWQDPAGMVYLRARWYNPSLGRFTQVDPQAGDLTAPATQHPYAYVLNRPLILRDPTGLRIPDEDAGTGGNPYQGSPLTSAQIEWAKLLAHKYEIPFEFLASVLHTQRIHDYGLQDRLEDAAVQGALFQIELRPYRAGVSPEQYLHPDFGPDLILTLVSLANLSLGLGQMRIGTARQMGEVFASQGLLCASQSSQEIIANLESDYGNISYVAAYLRFLADARTGHEGAHFEDLSTTDMQIIYGAFRAGIREAYGSELGFRSQAQPGRCGRLLAPETVELYRK